MQLPAPAGSTLQLSAFQAAVSSAQDPGELRGWLTGNGLPDGIALDLDLRWRVLVRLAVLGEIDRAGLQAALDAEPTAVSRVEHSRAMASLPDAEAKAWACSGSPARWTCPTTSSRLPASACGGTARRS